MTKIIAKTIKGKEFIYSKMDSYRVSKASADKVCEALNGARWNIKGDEVWKVYTVDSYTLDTLNALFERIAVRGGKLKIVRVY